MTSGLMTPGLIGFAIGLVLGVSSFLALRQVSARVDLAETRRVLGIVGVLELIALPVAGYLTGAYVFE